MPLTGLQDAVKTQKLPTNRSFGLVFTAFFLIVAFFPVLHGNPVRLWAIGVAGLFCITALTKPDLLLPLNKLWMSFGTLMHHIVSPIILGIIFFGLFTPAAAIMRLAKRDGLNQKFDKTATSYWVQRIPPGPDSSSITNQF